MPKESSKEIRAVILTADKFEDMELFFPYFRLIEEGVGVDIAAPTKGEIEGENGYRLNVNMTFDDINPDDYDILLLPGGSPVGAPTTVRKSPKAQAIAKAFFAKHKPVCAICHGPYTLISAGLLKGRKATGFWGDGVPDEIKKAGAEYVDAEVVVDGNLVTSRYPMDLPAYMREMMKLIRKIRR
ncbi:MAG: type 1 glutamine amidotransferase domain-containing protein [Candidatus Atabeyarchaeum deiterrae]